MTWMLYPSLHVSALAFTSLLLFPDKADLSTYSLYKYCPRYSVTLNPGDVLFNPPWWWHVVDNLTVTSVAVATRWDTLWRDPSFYELNRTLAMLAMFNGRFPRFLFDHLVNNSGRGRLVLQAGGGAFEEDAMLETKNAQPRIENTYHGKVVEKIRTRQKW